MKLSTLGWHFLELDGSHIRRWSDGMPECFVREYITTMLFTELPDDHPDRKSGWFGGTHADRKWSKRVTKAAREIIERECRLFCAAAGALIGDNPKCAASDFWLTRNGHGSGFWDGKRTDDASIPDEFDDAGDQLTSLAKQFGEVTVQFYRGWVYHHDACCLTQLP